MDSFEFNKMAGAFLLALLTTTVIGYAGNALVHPAKLEKNAFVVDTTVVAAASASGAPAAMVKLDPVGPLLAAAAADAGKAVATRQCGSCHNFDKGGKNAVGPNLWSVVAGSKARLDSFKYSGALAAAAKQPGDDGKWTYENLNTFLANPRGYINGTSMGFAGLRGAQDRANVIAFLRGQSDSPPPLP